MNVYDIGDVARLTATVANTESGALVDPGNVVCTVVAPDKSTSNPTVTRVSTGLYIVDLDIEEAGEYRWAFDCEAPNKAAGEGVLKGKERYVAPPS